MENTTVICTECLNTLIRVNYQETKNNIDPVCLVCESRICFFCIKNACFRLCFNVKGQTKFICFQCRKGDGKSYRSENVIKIKSDDCVLVCKSLEFKSWMCKQDVDYNNEYWTLNLEQWRGFKQWLDGKCYKYELLDEQIILEKVLQIQN